MFVLILIPVIVAVIAQAIKLVTDGVPKNFDFEHMIGDYGGMPSSHTAFVVSMATVVGLSAGFNSPVFAVAFVLMIVVMRDAVGFRREIGYNAVFTNLIGREVFKKRKMEYLNEKMGHSVGQVAAGFILGVLLSLVLYYLLVL